MSQSIPTSSDNVPAKRPGVMIVRPILHEHTKENAATFKRWTVMHFRDLLNLKPLSDNTKGISRTLRYINTNGELFYTIHADDISIWKTNAYYAISRRLDLENTRPVENGEKVVLPAPHGFGDEPMVWHLVNASFGIFAEHCASQPERESEYNSLPLFLLSTAGGKTDGPPCLLVTLTHTGIQEDTGIEPPKQLTDLRAEAVNHLASDYADDGKVYTSIYRHVPGAQPDMHPTIVEGADGNGSWVVCVLVKGEISQDMQTHLKVSLDASVEEMRRREGETKERRLDWGVRVGVWEGEVFMT